MRFYYNDDRDNYVYDQLNNCDLHINKVCGLYDELWNDYRTCKKQNGELVERLFDLEEKIMFLNLTNKKLNILLDHKRDDINKMQSRLRIQKDKNRRADEKIKELINKQTDYVNYVSEVNK